MLLNKDRAFEVMDKYRLDGLLKSILGKNSNLRP